MWAPDTIAAKAMKKPKSEVKYSDGTPAEHCGNCQHFQRHDEACTLVAGEIRANKWCKLWDKRTQLRNS